MTEASAYPSLTHLIQAYLHQDYDVVHGDETAAVRAFADHEAPEAVAGLAADVDRFERENAGRLREAFLAAYRDDLDPGANDADVREFLGMIRGVVEDARA
jgi:hypothetical protein